MSTTNPTLKAIKCTYKDKCSGCQYWDCSYDQQKTEKIADLQRHLQTSDLSFSGEIPFLSAGTSRLRDRLDFSWKKGSLGLYHQDSHEILDLERCEQLSPALQNWLEDFRHIRWPVEKASFRLRVGPQGQRGVWIDMANLDIKNLLDERNLLMRLQERAFVEIGQKRKVPKLKEGLFKLQDPEHRVWFQTWYQQQPVNLYCQVASFTQPSLQANKLITESLRQWLIPGQAVLEFGSGIGNLTLPALSQASQVTACEIDELALEGLRRSLEELPPEVSHRLKIHRGDFQRKLNEDFTEFDCILVNPPRSGLQKFLKPLEELPAEKAPERFIYMSCYPESMVRDLQVLKKCGYGIRELKIIDQFPQTKHYEVLALLVKLSL